MSIATFVRSYLPCRKWRKSTRSQGNGNCLEFRFQNGHVQVRDSKDPQLQVLRFTPRAWTEFITAVAHGDVTM